MWNSTSFQTPGLQCVGWDVYCSSVVLNTTEKPLQTSANSITVILSGTQKHYFIKHATTNKNNNYKVIPALIRSETFQQKAIFTKPLHFNCEEKPSKHMEQFNCWVDMWIWTCDESKHVKLDCYPCNTEMRIFLWFTPDEFQYRWVYLSIRPWGALRSLKVLFTREVNNMPYFIFWSKFCMVNIPTISTKIFHKVNIILGLNT